MPRRLYVILGLISLASFKLGYTISSTVINTIKSLVASYFTRRPLSSSSSRFTPIKISKMASTRPMSSGMIRTSPNSSTDPSVSSNSSFSMFYRRLKPRAKRISQPAFFLADESTPVALDPETQDMVYLASQSSFASSASSESMLLVEPTHLVLRLPRATYLLRQLVARTAQIRANLHFTITPRVHERVLQMLETVGLLLVHIINALYPFNTSMAGFLPIFVFGLFFWAVMIIEFEEVRYNVCRVARRPHEIDISQSIIDNFFTFDMDNDGPPIPTRPIPTRETPRVSGASMTPPCQGDPSPLDMSDERKSALISLLAAVVLFWPKAGEWPQLARDGMYLRNVRNQTRRSESPESAKDSPNDRPDAGRQGPRRGSHSERAQDREDKG